ncbi:hypothetical protein CDAR_284351 [Caerostris darwini]|uniref:Uncharacterized protein n=1 Tax=Caerostris darwini TaxID=1538125 RepID=A0AAV4UPH6_9ARAC|nr:hypothetical protein CDAR_284351 [Caerostris darwini]
MLSSRPRRGSIICQIYDFHLSTHNQSLERTDMHESWAMVRNDFPPYMTYWVGGKRIRVGPEQINDALARSFISPENSPPLTLLVKGIKCRNFSFPQARNLKLNGLKAWL